MIYIIAIIVGIIAVNALFYAIKGVIYFPIQQAIGLLFFLIVLVLELVNGNY
jgi:hypothetical protein